MPLGIFTLIQTTVVASGVFNTGGRTCIVSGGTSHHIQLVDRLRQLVFARVALIVSMGSDGVSSKRKIGMSGFSPPRKWPSPLLSEELSLQTLADTTYVRLVHPDDVMGMCHSQESFEHDLSKVTRPGTGWSWLKQGRQLKETVLAKSRSHNAWAWLGRPPVDEYQFDPTKRWPQGW